MRKTLYTLFAVLGLCMFAGCGSSSKGDDASPLAKQLVGEWHLVSWNGAAPGVFDAYVSFASDKTFEIYQQIEQVGYQKYTGSYLIGNKMLRVNTATIRPGAALTKCRSMSRAIRSRW